MEIFPIGWILLNVGMMSKILCYLIMSKLLLSKCKIFGMVPTFRRIHPIVRTTVFFVCLPMFKSQVDGVAVNAEIPAAYSPPH